MCICILSRSTCRHSNAASATAFACVSALHVYVRTYVNLGSLVLNLSTDRRVLAASKPETPFAGGNRRPEQNLGGEITSLQTADDPHSGAMGANSPWGSKCSRCDGERPFFKPSHKVEPKESASGHQAAGSLQKDSAI